MNALTCQFAIAALLTSITISADATADRENDASMNESSLLGPRLRGELLDIWSQRRLLLIGETHGTNESPLVVSELFREAAQSSHVVLGLEFPKEDCIYITDYLRTTDLPLDITIASKGKFWHRKNQDGRSSSAMLKLINDVKASRDSGMRVDLECFDSYTLEPGASSDESMARSIKRILADDRYTDAKFLFLTGNYHGRYSPESSPPSMASLLRQSHPFTLLIRSIKPGTSWNCVDQICAAHEFAPKRYLDVPTPSLLMHGDPDKIGFDGTLLIERFTASPPLP